MKIALDNQCSKRMAEEFNRSGFEVVIRAQDEMDGDWVREALYLDAEIFISPDLDIPNLLDRLDSEALWIDVPQKMKGKELTDFLLNKMNAIKKMRGIDEL